MLALPAVIVLGVALAGAAFWKLTEFLRSLLQWLAS
jgi:hypothetical protein